ncbi:hypothetical protein JKA74_11600 [Marivirga sp. S37H4]|uniref:Uncharacterized protein n=1 Tax=Marivirga aurantiaca TaxID=2802615 RepID=A0A934WYS9_9BACT|nr:hypothetical protein [Marivirga aurantiaca]MBK6265683.1 hypothetical protein [Marivirga aurantiaca]
MEKDKKKIIYLDMDDTICIYRKQYENYKELYPEVEFPQSVNGFFRELEFSKGAEEVVQKLFKDSRYQVYILTAPSIYNPACYTEKRIWVEEKLGFDWVERLIIAYDKSLLKGDYLIDDYAEGRGQDLFDGKLIHFGSKDFPDWESIGKYFE